MKTLFIINENISQSQLEQTYLLILAMLNFDHDVDLVFINDAFNRIKRDEALKKQWLALKIYGADNFFNLTHNGNKPGPGLITISQADFEKLKNQADILS